MLDLAGRGARALVTIVLVAACARRTPPSSVAPAPPPAIEVRLMPQGSPPAVVEPPALRPADLTPPTTLRSPHLTIRSITGHDAVYQRHMAYAAFIPGGRLLTGGGDGAIRIWRLDGARLLREQAPRADEKSSYADGWSVSPDGKLVAIQMHRGTFDVFEVDSGRLVQRQTGLWDLRQIAFSGPRTLMLLETDPTTRYRQIRAFDAVDGRTIATAVVLGAVAFAPAPDGSRVAVAGPTWLKVIRGSLEGDPLWDAATPICDRDAGPIEQQLWVANRACSPALLWNGDGSRLVEVAGTTIAIFDGAGGRRFWETARDDLYKPILRASISVDGKLALAGESYSFLLPGFERLPPETPNRFKHRKNIAQGDGQTFSPDGRQLLLLQRGQVRALDAETAEPVVVDGGHAGTVRHLAAASDGKRLLSAGYDRSVRLWDETREVRRWRLDSEYLAFTPEGDRFVTTRADPSTFPGEAVFIDPASGATLLSIPKLSTVALSPDGSALASLGVVEGLCLFDSRTGARRWCHKPNEMNSAGALAFLPGRGGVVAADKKYQLRVWDFGTGKPIRSFGESFTHVFLPIGDKPTSAVVQARDLRGGVLQSLVPGAALPSWQHAMPDPIAVSPDGKYLLARWRDLSYGIIYVLRLRDGVVIDSLDPCLADELFTSAAWSSDGARIYAGSWRGRIYEIDFDREAAETAGAYEPENKAELSSCHVRWN